MPRKAKAYSTRWVERKRPCRMFVLRRKGEVLFTQAVGRDCSSRRIILSGVDGVDITFTIFLGKAGEGFKKVRYRVSETIRIRRGRARVTILARNGKHEIYIVSAGDTLFIRAGQGYDMKFLTNSVWDCHFTPYGRTLPRVEKYLENYYRKAV